MNASKFFRSLVIVFLIVFVLSIFYQSDIFYNQFILPGLMLLSFREYVVQRQKSIMMNYRAALILLD